MINQKQLINKEFIRNSQQQLKDIKEENQILENQQLNEQQYNENDDCKKQKYLQSSDEQQQEQANNFLSHNPINFTQFRLLNVYMSQIIGSSFINNSQNLKQILEIVEKKKKNLTYTSLLFKLLQGYHQTQLQALQFLILQDGKFQKCNSFVTELIIHKIQNSRNYQIVKIQVQLLCYKTHITILNQIKQSYLHQVKVSNSGSFGDVYLVNFYNQKYAVKCIPFSFNSVSEDNQLFEKITQIKVVIYQYFLLLLFSALKIGPKVKKIMQFDLIITQKCVQFTTQICKKMNFYNQQDSNQLCECLKKMHILRIAHCDIKPDNVMYSLEYQKVVLIDFGGSKVLNQFIGQKSFCNRFIGTAGYCSEQMMKIIQRPRQYVDFYFNDAVGFSRTKQSQNNSVSLKSENNYIKLNLEMKICQINNFQMYLNKLKYNFYEYNQDQINKTWKIIKIRFFQLIQVIQTEVLYFFQELQYFYNFLLSFYRQQISWQTKNLSQLKKLKSHFRKNQKSTHNMLISDKRKKFVKEKQLYELIINQKNQLKPQTKQIMYHLINKDRIDKYFLSNGNQIQLQNKKYPFQNLVTYCIVVAKSSFINRNYYNTLINIKIQKCKQIREFINKHFKELNKSLKLIFTCQIKQLKPIAEFYQFFVIQIWKFIPQQIRINFISDLISTLCMLGYPHYLFEAKQYLIYHLISGQQQKYIKMKIFWKCNLAILNSEIINYNKDQTNFYLSLHEEQQYKIVQNEIQLMKYIKQDYQQSFQFMNNLLYQNIYLQNNLVDKDQIIQIYYKCCIQWNVNIKVTKQLFQQWRQIIQYILNILHDTNTIISVMRISLPKLTKNFIALAYKIHLHQVWAIKIDKEYQLLDCIAVQDIINIIDQNINYQLINSRYLIHYRILIAVNKQNITLLNRYIGLIIQLNLGQFQQINLLNKLINILYSFFQINLFKLTSQGQFVKRIFASILPLFVKVSNIISTYHYAINNNENNRQRKHKIQIKIKTIQLGKIISMAITINQIYKMMCFLLTQNKQILYEPSSQNESILQIRKIQIISNIKQNQIMQLFQKLISLSNLKLSQFVQKIRQDSDFKHLVNQNVIIRNGLSIFYCALIKRNQNQNSQLIKIIQNIWKDITYQDLSNYKPQYTANLYIFVFYVRSKIIQSNYDIYWCQKMIKLNDLLINAILWGVIMVQANLKVIINAFIYSHQQFSKLQTFLLIICNQSRINPIQLNIKALSKVCQQMIYLHQKQTLQLYLQLKWSVQQFISSLSNNIVNLNYNKDAYMSIIYIHCLQKNQQQNQRRIIFKFIYNSVQYLVGFAKKIVLQSIYGKRTNLVQFVNTYCPSLLPKVLKNYIRSQNNCLVQQYKQRPPIMLVEKQFYNWIRFIKHQQRKFQLDEIVQKIFLFKQYFYIQWGMPDDIKNIYRQKLFKYHFIKQSCL